MIIKSIRFKNFFSFRDCKVELNNLNALIGINGSGKSNFIKAIKLLKATVTEGALPDLILNQWGGFDAMYFAGNGSLNYRTELEYEFDTFSLPFEDHYPLYHHYHITFDKVGSSQNYTIKECLYTKGVENVVINEFLNVQNGKGTVLDKYSDNRVINIDFESSNTESILCQAFDPTRFFDINDIRNAIKKIAVYSGFDTTPNSPIRKPMLPNGVSSRLLPDGGNLPQILNRIKINNKSFYNKLIDSLQAINPQFNGIDFNFIGTNIELMLDEKGFERSIHVTHISDGTLRFLCLLAIVHNPERGGLICIDEPEIGLHPDMIREFVDSMNNVSNETQFIISTHSDHILNNLSVENVLVCEKDDDNGTIINTFRDKDFVEWAAQYSTGKLWRNGDLGGNRY